MATTPSPASPIHGARILVVEDEWIISMDLETELAGFGCEVVGPAASVAKAVELASVEAIDGALLDVNVAGETVYAVARTLAERNIPFAFVTGYGAEWLSEAWRDRPRLQKPVDTRNLKLILGVMLGARTQ